MSLKVFSGITAAVAGGIGFISSGFTRLQNLRYVDICKRIAGDVARNRQQAMEATSGIGTNLQRIGQIAELVQKNSEEAWAGGQRCARILADHANPLGIRVSFIVGGALLVGAAAAAAVALVRCYRNRKKQQPVQEQAQSAAISGLPRELPVRPEGFVTARHVPPPVPEAPAPALAPGPAVVRPDAAGTASPTAEEKLRSEWEKRRAAVIAGTIGR